MKCLIILAFPIISTLAYGQEKVTIKDPDITFSYQKPKGWNSQDDPLYHFVTKPIKNPNATEPQVAITYYDGSCNDLDECFEAQEKGLLPAMIPQFKKLASGEETIDGTRAKWIKFSGVTNPDRPDITAMNYSYFFIKHNQYFVVTIALPLQTTDAEMEALSIVRSLNARKN
jgi:hypothetical protein